ncbi:hypothetical protein E2C01_090644 [Portunus trituberculatus]|uniref:Uncharacterized protein n=1 Tax=Portunus trituberculatus TaxID=210409 RepID=A0A5B7JH62_PORTR|nr:hypothetical protein [Portunus trituberculatus]
MIRPKLEYAAVVWSLSSKKDKEDLVLVKEEDRTRGHVKKIRMRQCVKDIGMFTTSFGFLLPLLTTLVN